MATFGELCSNVFDEIDGRVVEFTTTNLGKNSEGVYYLTEPSERQVVRWVRDSYRRILNFSDFWDFLHGRGTFLNVREGVVDYKTPLIEKISKSSLYYTRSGSSARTPVFVEDYPWWVQQEQSSVSTSGSPLYVIETPGEDWKVWPIPTFDCTISGDWWTEPADLFHVNDEPIWDTKYHSILVWDAIRMFAFEYQDRETSSQLMERVNANLPFLWNRFKQENLQSIGSPSSFISQHS